ncbi:hypothetical protein DSOL_3848 [Desulfosporosinus metallidurans]|uniref:Uncharacterized protein n=1 Tax=Desulfosporosinus metallidurans TaxID=1888891 RepID=A0A1Q8QNI0_9FIRM|nr:hypothetical protein DSOL_3848 [Desulfosporosinus metallidurans]
MTGSSMIYDFSLVFPMIFYIGCFAFLAYFMVNAIRFLKRKDLHDKELLQKMDELIKCHNQLSDKKIN